MRDTFHCDDKDTLMAFLYGEISPPERQRVEAHLRHCAACAQEIDALTTVRAELATWAPPDVETGFGATGLPAAMARPTPWWSQVPVWAQLAAAALVVAAGASVANLQVRSGSDGIVVSTGWLPPARPAAPVAPVSVDENWKPALAALEARLRAEMARGRVDTPATVAATSGSDADASAVLRQVRTLLEQSERQQRQELALRITQLNHDMDIQRRADLVRIEQGLGQVEGRTGAEMARQRQLLNYVMRVSGQPQ